LNVLDLFSGIGGFSLGLERAGMRTVAFCEIEPFCRRVLAKHWPGVPCYEDIRHLTGDILAADGIVADVLCGGFPCQDISVAGKGEGLAGERSGLWQEYRRLVGELRPEYVIVENVAALLGRGLGVVLGDLAALGYDAEWHCIPASAVGAPHRRDRLWVVANARGGRSGRSGEGEVQQQGRAETVSPSEAVTNTDDTRCEQQRWGVSVRAQLVAAECAHWWSAEPDVGRVANGVPNRVDRLHALGNAVVPQIPEIIGRAILASQKATLIPQ
jgi:DNA (cytosine-5)-methyltransferase 1